MQKGIKRAKGVNLTYLVITVVVSIIIAGTALVVIIRPSSESSSERVGSKGDTAFGKLPTLQTSASGASRALGMPEGDGMDIGFVMPRMEYVWKGGTFPEFGDKMVVYRKPTKKISLTEAKKLAAAFGISGEPQVEDPKILIEEDINNVSPGGSAPASPAETNPIEPEPRDPRMTNEQSPFKTYMFFDEKEGKRLDIYEADQRFSYSVDGGFELAERNNEKLPSDDDAKKIAKDFLESRGLLPEDATGPFILDVPTIGYGIAVPDRPVSSVENHTDTVTKEFMRPTCIEVQFGRKFGGHDLVEPSGEPSRYVATVTIGPDGKVITAFGELPTELEESPYPLMDVSTAFNEIKKGAYEPIRTLGIPMSAQPEGFAQPSVGMTEPGSATESTISSGGGSQPGNRGIDVAPMPPDTKEVPAEQPVIKVEFNAVKLAYMVLIDPTGIGFYEPAYVFSGVTVDPEGHKSDYAIAIPAVASEHIEKRRSS